MDSLSRISSRRRAVVLAFAQTLLAGVLFHPMAASSAERAVAIPPPDNEPAPSATAGTETAVVAGGCFWGVQGVFQHVKGVTSAVSGYAGGEAKTANYETVGRGSSGHAEAVRVVFDPKQISYGQILEIFFSVAHNPTELNRQGPDIGTQYRSAIFPANADQVRIAKNYIAKLDKAGVYPARIVTTNEPMKVFYPAEAYHQDFLTRNPNHPYIVENDLPKVAELKRVFPQRFRPLPVLVGAGT